MSRLVYLYYTLHINSVSFHYKEVWAIAHAWHRQSRRGLHSTDVNCVEWQVPNFKGEGKQRYRLRVGGLEFCGDLQVTQFKAVSVIPSLCLTRICIIRIEARQFAITVICEIRVCFESDACTTSSDCTRCCECSCSRSGSVGIR
jgi:hypothetical protein